MVSKFSRKILCSSMPLGLCTCCCLHLECPYPYSPIIKLHHIFQESTQMILSWWSFLFDLPHNWIKFDIFIVHQQLNMVGWKHTTVEMSHFKYVTTNFMQVLGVFWQFYTSLVHSFSIHSRGLFYTFSSPILTYGQMMNLLPTSERIKSNQKRTSASSHCHI